MFHTLGARIYNYLHPEACRSLNSFQEQAMTAFFQAMTQKRLRLICSGDSIPCQKNHDCATRAEDRIAHWVCPDDQGDNQAAIRSSVLLEG